MTRAARCVSHTLERARCELGDGHAAPHMAQLGSGVLVSWPVALHGAEAAEMAGLGDDDPQQAGHHDR